MSLESPSGGGRGPVPFTRRLSQPSFAVATVLAALVGLQFAGATKSTGTRLMAAWSHRSSDAVSTMPGAVTVPGAVTALAATRADSGAGLRFLPPADTGGTAITGYQVSTDAGSSWAPLATTGTSPLLATVTGLSNGTLYRVAVRADNTVGNGDTGAVVTVTPATTPDAPDGVIAAATGASVTVAWNVPPSGGSPVTSYTVTASPGGATCTVAARAGAGASNTCTFGGLTEGTAYAFVVSATNSVGSSVASDPSNLVTLTTAPGIVTSLSVRAGNDAVTVSFGAPADDGGSPVTRYDMSTDGGTTWTAITPGPTDPMSVTRGGLTDGVTYRVAVRAGNLAGNGATGMRVTAVPYSTVGLAHLSGGGYLTVTKAGHVHTHDGARWLGSPFSSGVHLATPVVGIAAEGDGGYVVVTAGGAVYTYGTTFYGSPGRGTLTAPIVGITAGTHNGYLLVSADGTVSNYHTAAHGSPAAGTLTSPIVGITARANGGYLMVSATGSVYNFGARWYGSPHARGVALTAPVVAITARANGGYLVATANGHIYSFKGAWLGSPFAADADNRVPITAIASGPGDRYVGAAANDATYAYPTG